MGNFLGNLAQGAIGFAPYALKAVRENDDRNLAEAAQKLAQDRQAKQDALTEAIGRSTIAKNTATADGQWGPTFNATDPATGQPGMFQQHKTTGEVRPVRVTGDAPAPSAPPQASPDFAGPSSTDWQSALMQRPRPQSGPQSGQPTPSGTPLPGPPAPGLRPYVKPAPDPKVDPLSGQGIAAAGQRAGAVAAAQAPFKQPKAVSAPKIDPNSPAGITADSTKKANAAAIKAGAAPGGGGGATAAKEQIYVDLMDQSYPTMERLVGKVRPAAIAAAIHYPTAANATLTQDEQTYLASARDFLAGMLHAESGARLSAEQLNFGLQRVLPNLGDTPQTLQAKLASAKQTLAARKALFSAPQGGGRGGATGNIDLRTPSSASTKEQQLWDAAVAKHGQDKVLKEYGPRPGGEE